MDAGELDTALVLEARTRVPDGGGGWTESWAPLGTIWARMRAGRGREDEIGARPHGEVSHRVTVRSAPVGSPRRPRADQRFLAGARVLDILAVAEAPERGFLICWCREGPLA